jgi:hypothetical protein
MITVQLKGPEKITAQVKPITATSGGGIKQEVDPTVPDWAKQPEKPAYTAEEVGAIPAEKLPEAINAALAQAKESGEFDGKPGKPGTTPHIGANGNWYIGETDTGVKAQGKDYVLTESDKQEIAEQAAELIDAELLSIIGSGVTA